MPVIEGSQGRMQTVAAPPTNGVAGTGAGVMGKGTLLMDASTGILYSNTNTLASPTWTKVGTQT